MALWLLLWLQRRRSHKTLKFLFSPENEPEEQLRRLA
jgi:hypothetical protein